MKKNSVRTTMFFLIVILVPCIYGFLLDNQQSENGQHIANAQFLTTSEFYEEIKLRDQATERLRQDTSFWQHEINKNLVLLTSQLQQKFDTLEQTLSPDQLLNETKNDLKLLKERYRSLEQNYNMLQQENNALQKNYVKVVNDITTIRNRTKHVEDKYFKQEAVNSMTRVQLCVQGEELIAIKNKSRNLEREMTALTQLGNIKPTQEITALQQNIQFLTSETNSLKMKEHARSQDFLALINMTVDTKRSLSEVGSVMDRRIYELEQNQSVVITKMLDNIESYQIRQNNTLGDIENNILETRKIANETYRNLQNRINTNEEEKVAITAFLPSDVHLIAGSLVLFSNVKFSVGMGNMTDFERNGKFICEKEGLYIISVTILTVTNAGEFYLYVNGSIFATSYKYQSNAWWSSSSIIISLELQVNDSVWIQTNGIQVRGGLYSHLTIVKIN